MQYIQVSAYKIYNSDMQIKVYKIYNYWYTRHTTIGIQYIQVSAYKIYSSDIQLKVYNIYNYWHTRHKTIGIQDIELSVCKIYNHRYTRYTTIGIQDIQLSLFEAKWLRINKRVDMRRWSTDFFEQSSTPRDAISDNNLAGRLLSIVSTRNYTEKLYLLNLPEDNNLFCFAQCQSRIL